MGLAEGSNRKAPRGFRVSLWSLSFLSFSLKPFIILNNWGLLQIEWVNFDEKWELSMGR
jgi:hypothetical protein